MKLTNAREWHCPCRGILTVALVSGRGAAAKTIRPDPATTPRGVRSESKARIQKAIDRGVEFSRRARTRTLLGHRERDPGCGYTRCPGSLDASAWRNLLCVRALRAGERRRTTRSGTSHKGEAAATTAAALQHMWHTYAGKALYGIWQSPRLRRPDARLKQAIEKTSSF